MKNKCSGLRGVCGRAITYNAINIDQTTKSFHANGHESYNTSPLQNHTNRHNTHWNTPQPIHPPDRVTT